jgi:hypothetical protein
MTSNKNLKLMHGGRDALESNLVIALLEGNIDMLDIILAQLEDIEKMPAPKLALVEMPK